MVRINAVHEKPRTSKLRVEAGALQVRHPGASSDPEAALVIPVFNGMPTDQDTRGGFLGLGKRRTPEEERERDEQKADRRERERKWRMHNERRRAVAKREAELRKSPEFAGRLAEANKNVKAAEKEYKKAHNIFADFGWVKQSVGAFATKERTARTAVDILKGAGAGALVLALGPMVATVGGTLLFAVGVIQTLKGLITRNGRDIYEGLTNTAKGVGIFSVGILLSTVAYSAGTLGAALLGAKIGGALGFLSGFAQGFNDSRNVRLARIVGPAEAIYDQAKNTLRKIHSEIYHKADAETPPLAESDK